MTHSWTQVYLGPIKMYVVNFLYSGGLWQHEIGIVMVDGPAEGKAGDCLDWIAGGLEIKGLKDSGNPCPL